MYRDSLYAIYQYATVTACTYTLTASTTANVGQVIVAHPSIYVTTDTDVSATIERGVNNQRIIQAGMAPYELKRRVEMHKLFGKPSKAAVLIDDLFRHDSTTNPSNQAYLTIYTASTNLAASECSFMLTLDYEVEFFEPVKIAQS